MKSIVKIAGNEVIFETGEIAKQAHGAVLVRQRDTMVLVTVVADEEQQEISGADFFPLSVEYRERTAAAGRIPGGFVKRESKPQEHEILASRFIDRSIRPLFPETFFSETQVIATVLSYDKDAEPEILSVLGASAALCVSEIPWNGPVGGLRLVYKNDRFIALPNEEDRKNAEMDMVISCSKEGLVMLEGEAREISEQIFQEGIEYAQQALHDFFEMMDVWKKEVNVTKRTCPELVVPEDFRLALDQLALGAMRKAIVGPNKKMRAQQIKEVYKTVTTGLVEKFPDVSETTITYLLDQMKYKVFREYLVQEQKRVDGRNYTEIRPISGKVNWLPRNHGSALFCRGETQAVVSCTLGTPEDEQIVESLSGESRQKFMLHYNFPPYSVGEVKPVRGPGRREIGHGFLATRALQQILPSEIDFPYTIRLISDITESNGSSSMATVCGGCLALMDAGVKISQMVAGVAMGLVKEQDKLVVLTDIMGEEDHMGDMDFKVAGSERGITAVQMDNKLGSIPADVMTQALEQARQGRLFILGEMRKILDQPRAELSPYAPRVSSFFIRRERIRDLIGPGGKNIQEIQEDCNVRIDVQSNNGKVTVYSFNQNSSDKALKRISFLTGDPEQGRCYRGEVTGVKAFGAFVRIFNNIEGLVHISELSVGRVEKTSDVVKEGETIIVKVLGVDRQGKIRLSRKEALNVPESEIAN